MYKCCDRSSNFTLCLIHTSVKGMLIFVVFHARVRMYLFISVRVRASVCVCTCALESVFDSQTTIMPTLEQYRDYSRFSILLADPGLTNSKQLALSNDEKQHHQTIRKIKCIIETDRHC